MSYKIKLEVFEGPLDLLLYLIKKDKIDILDIPIARITEQYLEYLELMRLLDLDIAGEFLVMTATLMHIKSRMLLPPEEREMLEEPEEDPRAELVRRLLEYQKFKKASGYLENLWSRRSKVFARFQKEDFGDDEPYFEASLFDLITAFSQVLAAAPQKTFQEILIDEFTVEEKMGQILDILKRKSKAFFTNLFKNIKNKMEIVCIFLALLELIRIKEVVVRQPKLFGEILVIKT